MANKIQIKRSTANATVTGLSNGELAFTQASNTLWIGLPDGSGTAAIAGVRNPGTLTANQALVANATSGIDKVIVANLVPTTVWANGAAGSAGDFLTSNGSAVYWKTPSAGVAGSDTQVQFNDGGVLAGSAGLTFNKTTASLSTNNVYATSVVNAASHTIGTTFIANTTGAYHTGTMNAASFTVGTSTVSNATGVWTTGTVNATTIQVGSSVTANSTKFVIGTAVGLQANGGVGTAGQTLTSNGTTVYWANNVTKITAANGMVANASTGDIQLDVGQGNGISVSADAIAVTGGSTLTVNASGVHVNSALSITDLSLSGNLTVSGTLTTLNTQTLTVNDNIIELALNNTTTDIVDSGWYSPAGNSSAIWYSGIVRIAAQSTNTNPLFKVFVSNTNPNTSTTIDTSANTKTGSLQAYLLPYGTGGAFVANSSNVQITANSTVGVNITANTLSLSTALSGTNGGTGLSSIANNSLIFGNSTNGFNTLALGTSGYVLQSNGTAIVYDVLDGGTF